MLSPCGIYIQFPTCMTGNEVEVNHSMATHSDKHNSWREMAREGALWLFIHRYRLTYHIIHYWAIHSDVIIIMICTNSFPPSVDICLPVFQFGGNAVMVVSERFRFNLFSSAISFPGENREHLSLWKCMVIGNRIKPINFKHILGVWGGGGGGGGVSNIFEKEQS